MKWRAIPMRSWILLIGLLAITVGSQRQNKRPVIRPYFGESEDNITFYLGDDAKLVCTVHNLGTKTVIWRRTREPNPLTIGLFPYVETKRISVNHNQYKDQWNLHIRDVSFRDAGVYECQISTNDALVKHFLLNIIERPPGVKKPVAAVVLTGTDVVEILEPIVLTCNATGEKEPPRDVDWFKDGNRVASNAETQIEIYKYMRHEDRSMVSRLSIPRSRKSDAGIYLCRSSDQLAESIRVHVLNKNEKLASKISRSSNTETNNFKRGTELENRDTEKTDGTGFGYDVEASVKTSANKEKQTDEHSNAIHTIPQLCSCLGLAIITLYLATLMHRRWLS